MVHLLQEGVDIAALSAAKAVVKTHLGPHMEARCALVVERTQSLHRSNPGRLQLHVVAHDVCDIGSGLDLFDVTLSNQSGHD